MREQTLKKRILIYIRVTTQAIHFPTRNALFLPPSGEGIARFAGNTDLGLSNYTSEPIAYAFSQQALRTSVVGSCYFSIGNWSGLSQYFPWNMLLLLSNAPEGASGIWGRMHFSREAAKPQSTQKCKKCKEV
jgi:hypothetical protein